MFSRIRLTENFTLRELLWSDTAARESSLIETQLNPPPKVVNALEYLARTVLQPLRDEVGWPIRVTSGYRCEELNTLVRGSSGSQHMVGEAADIKVGDPVGFMNSEDTAEVRALCHMLYRTATSRQFPRDHNAEFYLFVMIALGIDEWDADQVIHEFGDAWGQPGWVHVASSERQDRRRITVVGHYTSGYEDFDSLGAAHGVFREGQR
jgi:hypothetical protein